MARLGRETEKARRAAAAVPRAVWAEIIDACLSVAELARAEAGGWVTDTLRESVEVRLRANGRALERLTGESWEH